MLLRKADWHDYDGLEYLLQHGADPNRMTWWHVTALHQAVRRDNALKNIELLLDHGADPLRRAATGCRRPRLRRDEAAATCLHVLERRGVPLEFSGVERLIAACASNDRAAVAPSPPTSPG